MSDKTYRIKGSIKDFALSFLDNAEDSKSLRKCANCNLVYAITDDWFDLTVCCAECYDKFADSLVRFVQEL